MEILEGGISVAGGGSINSFGLSVTGGISIYNAGLIFNFITFL